MATKYKVVIQCTYSHTLGVLDHASIFGYQAKICTYIEIGLCSVVSM